MDGNNGGIPAWAIMLWTFGLVLTAIVVMALAHDVHHAQVEAQALCSALDTLYGNGGG